MKHRTKILIIGLDGASFDHLTPMYPVLWDSAQEKQMFWFWPNAWYPECGNVWESEEFPRIVEEAGLVEYWEAKHWSDTCRPIDKDFSCSTEIWQEVRRAALRIRQAEIAARGAHPGAVPRRQRTGFLPRR